MSVILHIGAAKVGSSALQSALTWDLEGVDAGQRKAVYTALHPRFGLLHGAELRERARRNPSNYAATPRLGRLSCLETEQQAALARSLDDLCKRYDNVILSGETIYTELFEAGALDFLDKVSAPLCVVFYVRPQVAVANSAWWQWGAWGGESLDHFIDRTAPERMWHRAAKAWLDDGRIQSVNVRLTGPDIAADFFGLLGLDYSPGETRRSNTSLRGDVLRLFQRHPELRPDAHASAIDFALERGLGTGPPAPWVIDAEMAQRIIETHRPDNEALLEIIDAECRDAMVADPAWWRTDAFADRPVEPAHPVEIDGAASDALAAALVKRVAELDQHIRERPEPKPETPPAQGRLSRILRRR
ncbi:MAG: hypothetical protein HRU32_02105 [Rhodobacteraceae bacterium]|nr:hypothetical protein [Paracoccaceae bacterium]